MVIAEAPSSGTAASPARQPPSSLRMSMTVPISTQQRRRSRTTTRCSRASRRTSIDEVIRPRSNPKIPSFFNPTHEQKVWDAHELPEPARQLQFLARRAWFTECSESQTSLERGGHVVFERTVAANDWCMKRWRDLLIPGEALEVAIDGKYFERAVAATNPPGHWRRKAWMRNAHDQFATAAKDTLHFHDRPTVVLDVHQTHRRDDDVKSR